MRQWILAFIAIALGIIAFFQIKDSVAPQTLFDLPYVLPQKIVPNHIYPALKDYDAGELKKIATEEAKPEIDEFMENFKEKYPDPSAITAIFFSSQDSITFAQGHTVSGFGELMDNQGDPIGRINVTFVMNHPEEMRWSLQSISLP